VGLAIDHRFPPHAAHAQLGGDVQRHRTVIQAGQHAQRSAVEIVAGAEPIEQIDLGPDLDVAPETAAAGTQNTTDGLQGSFGRSRLKPRSFTEYNNMIRELAENVWR
jgi:hypothetical protein